MNFMQFIDAHIAEILHAIVAIGVAWIGYKQRALATAQKELHVLVNHRLDELLTSREEAGNLKGRAEQAEEQKNK